MAHPQRLDRPLPARGQRWLEPAATYLLLAQAQLLPIVVVPALPPGRPVGGASGISASDKPGACAWLRRGRDGFGLRRTIFRRTNPAFVGLAAVAVRDARWRALPAACSRRGGGAGMILRGSRAHRLQNHSGLGDCTSLLRRLLCKALTWARTSCGSITGRFLFRCPASG
jgi:hypothetical protein